MPGQGGRGFLPAGVQYSGLHDTGAAVESDATRDKRETTARVLRERMMPLVLKAWAIAGAKSCGRAPAAAGADESHTGWSQSSCHQRSRCWAPAARGRGATGVEPPVGTAEDLLAKYERTS